MATKKKRPPRGRLKRRALEVLEFDKVRARLAHCTSFPPSRDLADAIEPSYLPAEVARLQEETRESLRLLDLRPTLSFDGAADIRPMAHTGALGGQLPGSDLLQAAETFVVMRSARANLGRLRNELPRLAEMASGLCEFDEFVQAARGALSRSGEVLDDATDLLARLRVEERQTQERIQSRLEEIIASPEGQRCLQESFVATRGDRFVLAVKADFRGQFQGLIHDISATGATVFMEPLAIVELGNAWRELKLAAARETERILRSLTAMLGEREEEIVTAVERLATLDLALAKARLGRQMHGTVPAGIDEDEEEAVRLIDARHPLLGDDAVPMSLEIGKTYRALVISGPNTGGKTVALKTVGLLALMAQAGLPIPAAGGSALKVFDGVYADIGDEQSIEQSLSTFSAHMGNIVDVLAAATGKSLVLLDELGAGTDPQEGAALGKAILSTLTERRAVTVVTTHHSELKGFANVAGGVENANVEFDPLTLAPTFRLVVGVPGRSNALAIAERLGLPPAVLETAKSSVGQSAAEVESLLEDIQRRHAEAERERAGAEAERRAAEAERAALEHRVEALQEEHRQALLEQRVEAQVMAEEMKSRLRHAGRRAKALVNEKGRDELARLSTEVNEMRKKLETGPWKDAAPAAAVDGLKSGDLVRVRGLEPVAEVLEVAADGRVHVQAGPLRIEVPPDRIEGRAVRPKTAPKAGYTVDEGVKRRARVGDEFWVHGMRAQQAADAIDEYIEKAVLAEHHRVRIIHGKGRGILRDVIHRALDRHPLVGMFYDAEPDDGGEGVTIAEI